ncbi:uncharacterized protein BT62DRAFT_978476 [Guyanagaster necrorhizus]|uniref:Anti-proliferative protein domain-containing protein n=1 Tax=Guyanagaster necrorhizus TaxID=856835 RepID=A0A9P8AWE0_9AGAR|nr:uncharacterized protein BT62DRAFT_978476 [Guyanagaster necrorhizus MCA 3950]KAG7450230.1 hypothetical protein BT62DRAFT_978476 [Guyanagaster necrorhizus MCA 3950]
MAFSSSISVSVAVAHAVSFLTRPLMSAYPATTIIKLQLVLEANLTAHYAPSWVPFEPLSGSGRRCLTLSPDCLPPRVVYSACLATGIQWFDWIARLGGCEFDFCVDPGCVYMRVGSGNETVTIWAAEGPFSMNSKTVAQQLLEEDCDTDERLFDMIADEMNAPTWMTPVVPHFPIPRSTSPLSSISSHSRCSSRSSNSSSSYSFSSSDSVGSESSGSSTPTSTSTSSQSRREKARTSRVFVDTSKTEVTPYDGGKTTVLTGGVMLGGSPSAKAKKPSNKAPAGYWRTVHF